MMSMSAALQLIGLRVVTPLLQDALDSVEFVSGLADSKWGAVRAAMGRPDPWALKYLAIGNEVRAPQLDCAGQSTTCMLLRTVYQVLQPLCLSAFTW